MIPGLTFKSLIHFEFILVYGVRKWSSFNFLHIICCFSNTTYWYLQSIDHRGVGVFLGSLFYSTDLCVFSYAGVATGSFVPPDVGCCPLGVGLVGHCRPECLCHVWCLQGTTGMMGLSPFRVASPESLSMWSPEWDGHFPSIVTHGSPKGRAKTAGPSKAQALQELGQHHFCCILLVRWSPTLARTCVQGWGV